MTLIHSFTAKAPGSASISPASECPAPCPCPPLHKPVCPEKDALDGRTHPPSRTCSRRPDPQIPHSRSSRQVWGFLLTGPPELWVQEKWHGERRRCQTEAPWGPLEPLRNLSPQNRTWFSLVVRPSFTEGQFGGLGVGGRITLSVAVFPSFPCDPATSSSAVLQSINGVYGHRVQHSQGRLPGCPCSRSAAAFPAHLDTWGWEGPTRGPEARARRGAPWFQGKTTAITASSHGHGAQGVATGVKLFSGSTEDREGGSSFSNVWPHFLRSSWILASEGSGTGNRMGASPMQSVLL